MSSQVFGYETGPKAKAAKNCNEIQESYEK